MVLEEIFIGGVFVAGLLTAFVCFAYLLYATIMERHLLRTTRKSVRAGAPRAASSPVSASRVVATAEWRHGPGASTFPHSRG